MMHMTLLLTSMIKSDLVVITVFHPCGRPDAGLNKKIEVP
jgi:hypothetical protein